MPVPDEVMVLIAEGSRAWREQRYTDAQQTLQQAASLARELGSEDGEIGALHFLGNVAFNQCDDERSRAIHQEVLERCRASGNLAGAASSLGNLAPVDIVAGDLDAARSKYEEAIELYETACQAASAERVRAALEAYVVQRRPLMVHRTCSS